jgi:hypothetical protein
MQREQDLHLRCEQLRSTGVVVRLVQGASNGVCRRFGPSTS